MRLLLFLVALLGQVFIPGSSMPIAAETTKLLICVQAVSRRRAFLLSSAKSS